MPELKRYAATVDFYVFAESDKDAIKQAEDFCKEQTDKKDNQCKVIEIHDTPVASFYSRKLNIHAIMG